VRQWAGRTWEVGYFSWVPEVSLQSNISYLDWETDQDLPDYKKDAVGKQENFLKQPSSNKISCICGRKARDQDHTIHANFLSKANLPLNSTQLITDRCFHMEIWDTCIVPVWNWCVIWFPPCSSPSACTV
jgi:hypothetical protein